MTGSYEGDAARAVCVVGAGPGGLAAARTLAAHGVDVQLIDENVRIGGAITRRPFERGSDTVEEAERDLGATVRFIGESICHGFQDGAPVVTRRGRRLPLSPVATVVAVGARERIRPIPGSLLTGVMACGAAQTMLKGSDSYPYASAVVAGSGPLLLATASQLIEAGIRVRAVVEESGMLDGLDLRVGSRLLRSLPGNVAREGLAYGARILRHGAKLLSGYRVLSLHGETRVQRVTLAKVKSPATTRVFDVDSVVLGYGFVSASELIQQAGASVRFDAAGRHWIPERTEGFETSVSGLYAVGDCAGVHGREAAELEGALAACDILSSRFDIDAARLEMKVRRRLDKIGLFQEQMATLFPQAQLSDLDPDSIVCRCEGVTQREVAEAVDHGAADFRSVKLWTRAGMGICQGRTCHPVLEDQLTNAREMSPPRVQFPVRPLPFSVARDL